MQSAHSSQGSTCQKLTKSGGSKNGGAEDKRRGKRNVMDISQVPVDEYSGRLHDIGGKLRGHIPASARARRDKMMYPSESLASSEETPPARQDSYQTPDSIGTESNLRIENEIPFDEDFVAESMRLGQRTVPFERNIHGSSARGGHNRSGDRGHGFHFSNEEEPNDEGGSGDRGQAEPNYATNKVWRELTIGIDGGPTNPELLTGFLGHIAHSIWIGNDCKVLEGFNKPWSLIRFKDYLNDDVNHIVNNTHISRLPNRMHSKINMPLISAFVERWHPETNTFHMPFGEMTITLHDVHYLLRVPVHGRAVKTTMQPDALKVALTIHMQMTEAAVKSNFKSAGFKRSTIEATLKARVLPPKSHAIMYLLWLLGTSLFVDKSGDRVPVGFLQFLLTVDEVNTYAWGAAALANQYRQLGVATRINCRQIDGCLSLLQAWIYSYFPRLQSWNLGTVDKDETAIHLMYRSALDNVSPNEVRWTPFGLVAEEAVPISQYRGIIHCLTVTEAYMPDRVMRQFGYPQYIPTEPIKPVRVQRPPQPSLYCCSHAVRDSFEDFHTCRCNFHQQTIRVHFGHETISTYPDWFRQRTHMQVTRQESFTPGQQFQPVDMDPSVRIRLIAALMGRITRPNRHYMDAKDIFAVVDEVCEHLQDLIPN